MKIRNNNSCVSDGSKKNKENKEKNKNYCARGIFGRMSITAKVVVLYTILFTFSIVSISCLFMYSARSIGAGVVFASLKEISSSIQTYIEEGNELSEDKLDDIVSDNYVDYTIRNIDTGEVYVSNIFRAAEDNVNPPAAEPDNENGEKKEEAERVRFPFMLDNEYSVYTKDGKDYITVDNEAFGNGCLYSIRLFKSSSDIMQFVKYVESRLAYLNVAGVLLALMISTYISKVLLRPITKIMETAERISVEDLSQRIDIEGPNDELRELSMTFNSMIDRLERSFEQQSRFVSDASHELRTPISVIKGYANLINRWGKDDPEILQEAVNNILEETEHMSVLIKNLLFLARSDQHRNHVQIQPMTLNDAINDIARDLSVLEEKIKVTVNTSEKIVINGDPDLIKQMLWIYTENAIKYSGEEKSVEYSLYSEGNYACVSVKDNGFGISEEEIAHIFDRFYRVDKSRNKEIPGTGLGLSIARWIMDVHHGSIEVKSTVGVGTEFINKFPM